MWFLYLVCIIGSIFVLFGFVAMVAGPKWRGAPFVPSSRERIRTMIQLSDSLKPLRMADLGSGDGRIVIAFARAGIEAHGFELNPILVLWARLRIRVLGLQKKAFIHLGNYWKADLSPFDVVTVYGFPPIMTELEKKLRRELKPSARVFSNNFHFPNWTNVRKGDGVHVYHA